VPDTLTNAGTAPMYPVFQVFGPTSFFSIGNLANGLQFVYDASLPGASAIGSGDYAEITMFRNTIYLNGDQDNLKPGVNILLSDFFPLEVGDNIVTITGADALVKWQSAWL
jgi:hypothetical protein